MRLQKIHLVNFRNYTQSEFTFSTKYNFIIGLNGVGKTNLLEAITYLCLGKSGFGHLDQQNIKKNEKFFFLEGLISSTHSSSHITCSFDGKKKIQLDQKAISKISTYVGKFPVVVSSPDDIDIIKGDAENRRRFFDSILCQLDKIYLQTLIHYNHTLKQRNSLLKQLVFQKNHPDADLLNLYDQQLLDHGKILFQKRHDMIAEFLALFTYRYSLFKESEQVGITYQSDFSQPDLESIFKKSKQDDFRFQRTTVGIHRDDLEFTLENQILKRFASQGQQKTFLICLRLAQMDLLFKHLAIAPLLLLDDIFDKLDIDRIHHLLKIIQSPTIKQVFITQANEQLGKDFLYKIIKNDVSLFHLGI